MAICKDCIHWDACKNLLEHMNPDYKNKNIVIKSTCGKFKNKADYVEVKHGHWVKNKPNPKQMQEFHDLGIGKAMALNSIYWTCSECGEWGTPRYKFCPNCGAKMDGTPQKEG